MSLGECTAGRDLTAYSSESSDSRAVEQAVAAYCVTVPVVDQDCPQRQNYNATSRIVVVPVRKSDHHFDLVSPELFAPEQYSTWLSPTRADAFVALITIEEAGKKLLHLEVAKDRSSYMIYMLVLPVSHHAMTGRSCPLARDCSPPQCDWDTMAGTSR